MTRPRFALGPFTARARFGIAKVQGGGPADQLLADLAGEVSAAIIDGSADAGSILALPCTVLRDVVLATPSAAMGRDPQVRAAIQARAAACRDDDNFSFGPGFWDRVALGPIGDAVAGFAELFSPGRILEIVGNGVIALTGGLMIWLGAQRLFGGGP